MRKALAAFALIASPLALATDLGGDGLGGPSLQPRAQSAQLGEPGIANRELSQVDPVLIEAGEPALDFRFAKNKSLIESTTNKSSLITFSRSAAQSPGTYVGSDGLIHDAAVNLALYSEQFDNAAWVKGRSKVNANAAIAPDGKQTADKWVEDATASQTHFITSLIRPSGISTFSVFAKQGERKWLGLSMTSGVAQPYAFFDLENGVAGLTGSTGGTISTVAEIENVGNGWFRCSVTWGATTSGYVNVFGSPGDGVFSWSGDGTSGIYVWGAQLEETDPATMAPTAYIKTTSQALAAPRFDHDPVTGESLGLLVEEQRTNLVTRSEEFNLWTASGLNAFGSGSVVNAVVAPDGTMTADYIQEDTSTGSHFVYSNTVSISSGQPYTVSVYAKKGERTRLQVLLSGFTNFSPPASAYFDVDGGTIVSSTGTTASITDAGNGWFRCTVSGVASATTTTTAWLRLVQSGTTTSYLGDGTSGLFIWGAQVEQGAFPTSTIPTEGSAQTRYADVAAVQDEDFSTTNLVSYSESFDVSTWLKANIQVSENAIAAPNGSTTADKIESNSGTGFYSTYRGVSVTSGQQYTLSMYAKADEISKMFLSLTGPMTGRGMYDLDALTVTQTASYDGATIQDVGDGWRRITITDTATSTATMYFYVIMSLDGNYANISDPITAGNGLYLWGASLTQTEYPVEYTTTRNVFPNSQDFERSTWNYKVGATISENQTAAPDGTQTASLLTNTSSGYFASYFGKNGNPTGIQTFSIYAKKTTTDWCLLNFGNGVSTAVWFNLANGTVGTQTAGFVGAISDAGNGWYRLSITGNNTTGATFINKSNGDATGNTSAGDSVLIWGGQFEPGTTATDYVRTVDVVGKDYGWYEPTEGTVFVEGSFEGDYGSATTTVWGISNGTNTYRIQAYFSGGTTPAGLVATPTVYTIFRPAVSRPFDFAHAYTLKHGQHSIAFNGGVSTTSTSLFGPGGLNVMYIGQRADGVNGELLKKHIKRLTYWPRRQSDSTLQVITQ